MSAIFDEAICCVCSNSDPNKLKFLLAPNKHTKAAYDARGIWAKENGVTFSGSWSATGQPAMCITLNKNEDPSKVLSTVKKVIPLYTPIEGRVMFSILEKTRSQHGIYQLEVDPNTLYAYVTKTTYGHKQDLFKGELDKMLKRISQEIWYRKS